MEYLYATLLLHSAGKDINEENLKKVLEAAGIKPDEAKVKSVVSSLEGVNIDEVIQQATVAPVAAPAGGEAPQQEAPKEEEKKEEEEAEKKAEEAVAGLGALFG